MLDLNTTLLVNNNTILSLISLCFFSIWIYEDVTEYPYYLAVGYPANTL